ncbi:MAG: transcriptional regulator [Clostridia bacterium]|nr:transcriptional regulator [Clostridia bacterium]
MSDLGNKEIFSKNLKYYMTINKKTRNDICKDLNFKYTTFTDWYNGNIYPRIDKIEMLANYFRIEKSDLIEDSSKNRNLKIDNKQAFPLLGIVKGGYDYLSFENIIGHISIDNPLSDIENCYALKVTGDSMYPLMGEGDIIIVHKQDDFENGQTCIILINGDEATVKNVYKTEQGIKLVALNPYVPPKEFNFEEMKNTPVKIIGVVKEVRNRSSFK